MIVNRSISLCILLNLILLCQGQRHHQTAQKPPNKMGEVLSFPENEEEDPAKKNAMNKTPVSFPMKDGSTEGRCNEGEFLYPGDLKDDWVCDCRPAYIYYPPHNRCYAAWTRGPCRDSEYLVLPNNGFVPVCVHNICKENHVRFLNPESKQLQCYELGKPGPCDLPQLDNVIGVNETTLELICTKDYIIKSQAQQQQLQTRFMEEELVSNGTNYLKKACFIGGIRWTNFSCPPDYPEIQQPQMILNQNIQSIFSTSANFST